jgi:SP family general alpha glucoside:H+ symporter-like MFS transporter
MTLMQGIKLYPAAIAWSVLLSTAIVMEGYGELSSLDSRPTRQLPPLAWG